MPANKTKVDRLHDLLPRLLDSRNNTNIKALVEALGESDQETSDLIEEVRKQFFVKTASRPYLDRLAANNRISRPRLVGMEDDAFKEYIPVLSYKPKQVKLIIDQLLDIFFFKESTTAFVTSQNFSPFALQDGWELEYVVDELQTERIIFNADDFTDIANATVDEIVGAINREANYSYATLYYDSITKNSYVRLFSKTVGSKGSLRITGGRANIALRFNGFISASGLGSNTQWTVTKVGDTITFQYTAGSNPNLENIMKGDIVIINLTGNIGSFVIDEVDVFNNTITFKNLFGTAGVFTQTSSDDVKFIRPTKFVVYTNNKRAVTWETSPGEITVEMPSSPPVVKRSLKGSTHINGTFERMTNRDSDTSLTINDATVWPNSGSFYIEPLTEIKTRILTGSEDEVISKTQIGRLTSPVQKYEYTSKSGNTLLGITPNLPALASLNQFALTSLQRNGSNTGIATTGSAHGYLVGEYVIIFNSAGAVDTLNGTWRITAVPTSTSFEFASFGQSTGGAIATPGSSRLEREGLANEGSKIILTDSISSNTTKIKGSYLWSKNAPFVLSDQVATSSDVIHAGTIVRILNIGTNNIPDSGGYIVFDFGKNSQEGPVRYLYKPTANTIALDPSYQFEKSHPIGASLTAIRRKGPHTVSATGKEYAPYITDPSEARIILQDLIKTVKSAGIFVNFLVRYPEQLYATLDVYQSGVDPG